MKKKDKIILLIGIMFILTAAIELLLCFFGPIVLDTKSTIVVYPIYTLSGTNSRDALDEQEKKAILDSFHSHLEKSRKYIPIDRNHADNILKEQNLTLSEIVKTPSTKRYAEIAGLLGVEKFTMGYLLRTRVNDTEYEYELFINIFLTKLEESTLKLKHTAGTAEEMISDMNTFISRLDGENKGYSLPEILFIFALLLHMFFGLLLILRACLGEKITGNRYLARLFVSIELRGPELLFILMVLLFTFAYLFAVNANMDYVQIFMATGGNLHLAMNTAQERLNTAVRYLPLMVLTAFCFIWWRIKKKDYGLKDFLGDQFQVSWALPLTILGSLLMSLSFPSLISLEGFPLLAFIALVPLFLVIEKSRYGPAVFYGIVYGTLSTVFINYWLGSFSLVSLQFLMIVFLVFYTLFMFPGVWIYKLVSKRLGRWKVLVWPLAWVTFDWLHSMGFVGYPWGMIGTSQYAFLPLIQVSALCGVWGVTFLVVLTNAIITMVIEAFQDKKLRKLILPTAVWGGVMLINLTGGALYLNTETPPQTGKTLKVAMIQDSMDPRKHSTGDVIEKLIDMSEQVLPSSPDIIVWPEGSYNSDYEAFPSSALANTLREYQSRSGTWLLTGSMDYKDDELARQKNKIKDLKLLSYNSSMLLDPAGNVKQKYHKIHLVPFTEYFPYEKELPGVYKMLKDFDINWWEKGEEKVIFHHPDFTFFTPICFEDVFPAEVAGFVDQGADVIMNLSNDFWSISPVEGKQHAVSSLFRAVENHRPLLRTTTSGLSCYIDPHGRILADMPYFEPATLLVDVPLEKSRKTLYTRWGDWFPKGTLLVLLILAGFCILPLKNEKM